MTRPPRTLALLGCAAALALAALLAPACNAGDGATPEAQAGNAGAAGEGGGGSEGGAAGSENGSGGNAGGAVFAGCPPLDVIRSDINARDACKLLMDSVAGKYPKKFTYADALDLLGYGAQIGQLADDAMHKKSISVEEARQRQAEIDSACIAISGLGCVETFLGAGN